MIKYKDKYFLSKTVVSKPLTPKEWVVKLGINLGSVYLRIAKGNLYEVEYEV